MRSPPVRSPPTSASIPPPSSLHVGSLLTMMGLARLQRFGHLADRHRRRRHRDDRRSRSRRRNARCSRARTSSATSPGSGRSSRGCSTSTARPNPARIVNNADWLASFDLLGFLRDTGKYFTVNYLLQKEAVSRRLESEEGISFTEFSYPLLQARDYLELFDRYDCTLQMGGSDQWGNITAGIELDAQAARRGRSTAWSGR